MYFAFEAAVKERRQIVCLSGFDLFLCAVYKDFRKEPHGCPAERVSDQNKLCIAVPRDQRMIRKVPTEAVMPVFLAVADTIVHSGSGKLRIKLTGAVPRASVGSYRSRSAVEPLVTEVLHQIAASHPPIGFLLILLIIAAPSGKAMDKDIPKHAFILHITEFFITIP